MQSLSSAQAYVEILAGLIGAQAAEQRVASWLQEKLDLVGDRDFANRFRAHFGSIDAQPLDYTHRRFRVADGEALGGIRFLGGLADKPFVDVFAWSKDVEFTELIAAVTREWRAFNPFALRLISVPGWDVPGAYRDQSIHAARVSAMATDAGAAKLRETTDFEAAAKLVSDKYSALERLQPDLSAELFPATREQLKKCAKTGTLHLIEADGATAGLICTLPGALEFIDGYIVEEEVVLDGFNGRGLASAAQRALAGLLAARSPEAVLAGTIHRINHASRRSATTAGRPVLLEYVFVDL